MVTCHPKPDRTGLVEIVLHIGDKRVCDLLIPLRDSLDRGAINIAVKCSTGFIHSATADFYLDWLEGMEGSDQDGALVSLGFGRLICASRMGSGPPDNRA